MTHIKSCIKASPCVQLFYREWLLDPQRTDYHLVFDQSISGDLNLDYLKQALDGLLNTHILFRSHLINKKNTEKNINLYWQENISNSPNFSFFSLECFDFCDLENSVKNYLFTPFDLEKGPLYRFCIFSDELKKEHRLFLTIHHVLLDGLSFKDFINTISQNYKNIKNKTSLVTHKITSEISEDLDLKAQLLEKKQGLLKQYQPEIFWAKALKNLPESNQLPYSRSSTPAVPAGTTKPGVKSQRFDILINSLTPAFNNYATHNLLLLTWGVLITRYCHLNMPQQAAYISYPVSINKEERGLGFGAQINSLMMPIRLSRTKNFKDLYQEANNLIQQFKINNNLKYSDYPIDQILQAVFAQEQQKLKLNISFAQTDLKNRSLDFSDFTKIKINHDHDDIDIAGSELLLEYDLYSPASGVINFRLRYRADLFQEWQINLLIEQYRNLLNAILNNPEAPLISHSLTSSLPLQESREREGQKNNINMISLFESYASDPIHSARLALISYQDDQFLFGQKSYSYQELNQKSNQLARYIEKTYLNLTGQSIPPEILIPLIAERSIEMIIAILAILKTGGAYVPINPSYPKERIDFILKDTKARLVLADSQERIQDSSLHRSLINVDQYDLYAHESPENLGLIINPKNLAYVIYTSGTTGQPKGVMVEHHSVINLVKDSGYMTVNSQDVFMHISDPSFDAAVFEIWGALLNGALLFLPKSGLDLLGNPNFFKNYLIQNKISVLLLTKTLFDYFYQADQDLFASLTYLLVGGEALNAHLIQKLCQQKSQPKYLLNAYGPTEATTCSAIYHCQEKSPYASSYQIPIGKPFNRISIYVLDTYLQEVPVGTVGDLYIAGEGLARGYLNQEKLTAEKFITHILKNQKTPKKLYKTGDLARFLPDGNLEFFGRKDAQVKIRGHRIELSEIELVLTQHPKIKQAAVLLKTQKNALSDYLYLAAYYVLKNPGDPDNLSINLNNDLAKLLPDYMIPSIFILIDQLPMMPNGKLNFRLLPEPDFLNSLRSPGQIFKTPVEQEISKIWASILGLPDHKIQSNDHFFRLGGDSILSIQLSAALSSHGYACQVRDIYQNPELNKLADYLVRASSNSLNNSSYLISEKTSPVLITQMTYMQQYFFQYACGEKEKFGVLFPLIFTGDLDLARLKKAVQNILEIQDAFSLIYQKQGNTSSWVSKINQNNLCRFIQEPSPISLTHLVSKLEPLSDTINIQTGPALIIYICKLEGFKQEQIIVITHHLYLDRTSLGIFKNQLNYFYNHKKYPLKTYSFLSWANDLAHYVISQKEREKINDLWGCKLNNLTYSDGFFMDQGGFNLLEDRPENYGTMAFYLDLNFIQEAEKIRQKLPLFNLLFLTLFLTSYFLNLNKEKNKTIAIDNVFLGRDLQGKIAKESLENTMGWLATNLPVRLDFKDFDLKSLDQDLILNLNTQLLDITQPGHDLLYSMAKARTDLGFNLIGKSKALFNYYNRESDQRELEKEPEENEFVLSSIHSKIPMMYLEQVDYKLALTVFKNKKEIGFNLYFNRMNYTDQSMMDFIEIYKNTAGNLIKLMTESKSNVLA